jgi:hypothetical protein
MQTIKDEQFVRALYRRFCLRPVSDRASRLAIQNRRMQIQERDDGVLVVSICDREGSLLDIGWRLGLAWPMRVHPFDEAIRDADPQALSSLVRRFLLKHEVIDRKGLPIRRGAA